MSLSKQMPSSPSEFWALYYTLGSASSFYDHVHESHELLDGVPVALWDKVWQELASGRDRRPLALVNAWLPSLGRSFPQTFTYVEGSSHVGRFKHLVSDRCLVFCRSGGGWTTPCSFSSESLKERTERLRTCLHTVDEKGERVGLRPEFLGRVVLMYGSNDVQKLLQGQITHKLLLKQTVEYLKRISMWASKAEIQIYIQLRTGGHLTIFHAVVIKHVDN